MKTYVITFSWHFPKNHPRSGEPTCFVANLITCDKIHTIRANYPLWEKRIKEIREGRAVLSLRYWEGMPYRSKQKEFMKLTGEQVGIQKLTFFGDARGFRIDNLPLNNHINDLSRNDGLSADDFKQWFRGYSLSEPLAIIHFTKFRY